MNKRSHLENDIPIPRSSAGTLIQHHVIFLTGRAFTLIELLIVIAIIGILATIAGKTISYYRAKAYNITVKHDLKNFALAQEDYFLRYNRYHGNDGDKMEGGNPPSGSLISPDFNFRPSAGVEIKITGAGAALTAQASHKNATKKYKYSFSTGKITEAEE